MTSWVRLPDMAGTDGVPEPAELMSAIAMITPEYRWPVNITVAMPSGAPVVG